MKIRYAFQILIVALLASMQVGCASLLAKKHFDKAREEQAVRIQADGNSVMVGVDLLSTEYLSENWKVAIPAAILDGVIAYKTYEWVDEQIGGGSDGGSSRDNNINISGNDDSSINIDISGDSDNDTDTDTNNDDSNNTYN